jgi:hypothetical protein
MITGLVSRFGWMLMRAAFRRQTTLDKPLYQAEGQIHEAY